MAGVVLGHEPGDTSERLVGPHGERLGRGPVGRRRVLVAVGERPEHVEVREQAPLALAASWCRVHDHEAMDVMARHHARGVPHGRLARAGEHARVHGVVHAGAAQDRRRTIVRIRGLHGPTLRRAPAR